MGGLPFSSNFRAVFYKLIISIKKITWVTIAAAEELPEAEEAHHEEAGEDHPGEAEAGQVAAEGGEAEDAAAGEDPEGEEGPGEALERVPRYWLSHIRDSRAFMFSGERMMHFAPRISHQGNPSTTKRE